MATEEEDERDAEALARKLRIRRLLAIAVPLLLLAAPFIWFSVRVAEHEARDAERRAAEALSEGEVAALRATLDEAESAARAAQQRWNEGVRRDMLSHWQPGGGRCPARISAPQMGAGESYVKHGSIDGNYFGGWSYRILGGDPGDGAIAPPSAITWSLESIAALRGKVARGEAERGDLREAERIASGRAWSRDALVLIEVEERRDPLFLAGGVGLDTFSPGVLRGRAYVVESDGRVSCVGDVDAVNSEVIDFSYLATSPLDDFAKRNAAEATLQRDFEVELRKAIAASLEGAAEHRGEGAEPGELEATTDGAP
ncbi:MAG: hypothetical protein H6711_18060 [Myxococcales bacterium]|nr:hypothetical protein [Myxococcales bacterium]